MLRRSMKNVIADVATKVVYWFTTGFDISTVAFEDNMQCITERRWSWSFHLKFDVPFVFVNKCLPVNK